jgi:hypothetical protein
LAAAMKRSLPATSLGARRIADKALSGTSISNFTISD